MTSNVMRRICGRSPMAFLFVMPCRNRACVVRNGRTEIGLMSELVPATRIENAILLIRGERVLLDAD